MLRIVSGFSIAALLLLEGISLSGCVFDSTALNPSLERRRITEHFTLDAGDFVNDSLLPIYPNPFNRAAGDAEINFRFWISDSTQAIILIQNPLGEEVVRYEDSTLPAGQYQGSWEPLSNEREPLNPGLYFVTFRTERYILSRMLSIETN